MGPLTSLLKRNSFHWTDAAKEAFHNLKAAMAKPPVLGLLNFSKPLILNVKLPGAGNGIGAVLMQNGDILSICTDRVLTQLNPNE